MADQLKIALILTAVDKASAVFDKAGKKMNAHLKGLDKSKAFFNKYGNYATIAGGVAVAAFIPAIHAAEDNVIAVHRLEQVYKSMGQNVEKASKQSQEYASKLQFQIGVEDEEIMAVQSKLAIYKNLNNETNRTNGIVNRTTAALYDLAANGFGDAASNAVKLGKLLNDPIKNLNALSRAGVQFTTAEKKKIDALQRSGKLTQAQDIILKAVEKRVGGVAAATTTASQKARIAWSEVTESLGKGLLPIFTKYVKKITEHIPKIQAWIETHGTLIKNIALVSAAVLGLGVAMKVIAFGITGIQMAGAALSAVTTFLMANPIVLIIAAIAAAAYLIYNNWEKIAAFFRRLWANVKAIFLNTWNWIKNLFFKYHPAGIIYKHWDKIVAWFQNLWNKVKEKFHQFMQFLFSLPARFVKAGREFITGIWEGMKSVWFDVVAWVTEKTDWLAKKFSYSKYHSAQSAMDKAGKKQEIYQMSMNNTQAGGYGGNSTSSVYNPVSSNSSTMQYAPVITLNGGATQADADMVNSTTQKGFEKMMQKYNNNQQRTGYNN